VSVIYLAEEVVEKVINLCARRGVIFPTAEIYGTFAGFFDYGPVGVEIKIRILDNWWNYFVHCREDVVGIDGAIITSPKVWEASGHLKEFNDPLVECSKCKTKYRADHLIAQELGIEVDGIGIQQLTELIKKHKIVCPKDNGELLEAKPFNLMFKTFVGAEGGTDAFLRPETAQLIFADFKQTMMASRKQLPFGIAQIGKSFRNEIAPRNFVFRAREFEQMEIEFFVHPKKLNECAMPKNLLSLEMQILSSEMQEKKQEAKKMGIGTALEKKIIGTKWHALWLAECVQWFLSIGLKHENLRLRQHTKTELSHYSKETWDIEFLFGEWSWKELAGIANRGDYDLSQHEKHSKTDLHVFDAESGEKVLPHVIEPSFGLDRTVFALLVDAFNEKIEKGETKTILSLDATVAPLDAGVFPLMKKDGLDKKAREVYDALKKKFLVQYDESGSIGKRYARMDEIGVPWCITIDYDSLKKSDCTLRERDSAKQVRVKLKELPLVLQKLFSKEIPFSKAGKAV
jgi:glycyl-tRNA synthetase